MAEYNLKEDKIVYGQWACFKNICPKCFNLISNNHCNDCKIEIEIREMPDDLKEDLRARSDTLNSILMYRKNKIKDKIDKIMALNTTIDVAIIDFVNDTMKEMIFCNEFKDIKDLSMLYGSIEYYVDIKEKTFSIKMEKTSYSTSCAYSIRYRGNEHYIERENMSIFQGFIDHLDYFYNFLSKSSKNCNEIVYKKKIKNEMKKIEELLKWEEN